jgi:hypothetical protein
LGAPSDFSYLISLIALFAWTKWREIPPTDYYFTQKLSDSSVNFYDNDKASSLAVSLLGLRNLCGINNWAMIWLFAHIMISTPNKISDGILDTFCYLSANVPPAKVFFFFSLIVSCPKIE